VVVRVMVVVVEFAICFCSFPERVQFSSFDGHATPI
jgi:hypothetical protein